MRDRDKDALVWSLFFGGLVSFMNHPGRMARYEDRVMIGKDLDLCARIADSAYDRYIRRFGAKEI